MKRLLSTLVILAAIFAGTSNASSSLRPDSTWMRAAHCIHRHESVDWHKTTTWTGAPSTDHGGLQIEIGTWNTMLRMYPQITKNYPTDPADGTPWQQYQVGYLIWLNNGERFGDHQWYYSASNCHVA